MALLFFQLYTHPDAVFSDVAAHVDEEQGKDCGTPGVKGGASTDRYASHCGPRGTCVSSKAGSTTRSETRYMVVRCRVLPAAAQSDDLHRVFFHNGMFMGRRCSSARSQK